MRETILYDKQTRIAINDRHGFGLGCVVVELCYDELFAEGNLQVREARSGKDGLSTAVSVVTGSGRASVASSNYNCGYRLLADCRIPIVGSRVTRSTKP